MSTKTEEVRTVFTWDTGDVDKGVKRIETALDRVKQANNGAAQKKGHGADGNNFAMGIRDLAEGRGVNAMQRFGHTLGATAGRLAIYMLALKAAGEAMRHLREEMERTDSTSRELEADFSVKARTATTSSSAQKPGTLTASIKAMDEGSAKENEQQVGLGRAAEMLAAMKHGNPLSAAAAKAIETYNSFQGRRTPEEESKASEERGKYYGKEAARLRGMRSQSYGHETDMAQANGPGGNPYEAKRKELQIQQELEESEARTAGLSKTDLDNIRLRYDILRKTVGAEEHITLSRLAYRSQDTAIQGGPKSAFQKSIGLATARIGQSQRLINSGSLNQVQEQEEENRIQQENLGRRDTIMGRYLNPDGSRRRAGEINRDFRNDRKTERLRGRFQRLYENGGIDPETGRRRASGDAPNSGLHTGGLRSGGLSSGGLGPATDFKEALRPVLGGAGTDTAKTGGKTIDDLYALWDQRVPVATT